MFSLYAQMLYLEMKTKVKNEVYLPCVSDSLQNVTCLSLTHTTPLHQFDENQPSSLAVITKLKLAHSH